jgi:hypothetical protein
MKGNFPQKRSSALRCLREDYVHDASEGSHLMSSHIVLVDGDVVCGVLQCPIGKVHEIRLYLPPSASMAVQDINIVS